jgi:transposase
MTTEPVITTERIDDFPLLLATMLQLGLPDIFDHHLKRHGLHQGLSWGWIASIWLAHLLTKGNHRKQPVQAWVKQAHATIEKLSGQTVRDLDFTDDRLTLLLRRLSKSEIWQAIAKELSQNIMRVYDLNAERVRLDATTVSGYHEGGEESLFQYGYSKDDPTLRQVKVMVAALDPFGLPLVSQVVAGDVADDNLYRPAVDRVLQIIDGTGLLFVGDSKMSALATRAHIHRLEQHYLCPMAQTGEIAKEMAAWIEAANSGIQPVQPVYIKNEKGKRVLLAEGYAFERSVQIQIAPPDEASDADQEQTTEWTEQVFVIRSETYRKSQLNGLEGRLQRATAKLLALTPLPARGKRQIQEQAELVNAATAILKAHNVDDFLTYTFERQEKRATKYIRRGRGRANRPTREIVSARYQILTARRQPSRRIRKRLAGVFT